MLVYQRVHQADHDDRKVMGIQGWTMLGNLENTAGTWNFPLVIYYSTMAIKFHQFQQANNLQTCFCALLGTVITNRNGVNECTSQQQS